MTPPSITSPVPPAPPIAVPTAHGNGSSQYLHKLANGLTVVAEQIPGVRSAAMTFLIPAGAASDPIGQAGAATVLSDWILRGAGSRDSRQLTDAFDNLGVQRSASADNVFLRFSAALLGKNLTATLPLYGDIVRTPHLADDGFEPALDLAVQQLDAIEDEPSHKLSLLLRERHLPFPFNRPSSGKREDLDALTAEQLRHDFRSRITPRGTILSIAGMFNWPELVQTVEAAFGSWKPVDPVQLPSQPALRGIHHINQDTNQSQIGLGWDTVPDSHPDSIIQQAAINVLSGGMGARLFTEIREKQGLCYTVNAGYTSLKQSGAVFGYAGTSPDRAQRTLDSFLIELNRLAAGVTQGELDRALIGMKSRIIMQGDSSGSRAAALAGDFYHRGRTRTLDEVRKLIDSITLDRVNNFLATHPAQSLTIVTIGPNQLEVKGTG